MKDVGQSPIPFLAILNPFALCLYLLATMAEFDVCRLAREFLRTHGLIE
jgi:hypothetical protein